MGPRENNSRPAIDATPRSVGVCCGARAIDVVLTGTLGDGAPGGCAVRTSGGRAGVRPRMTPLTAWNRRSPDHVVNLADMPALVDKLVREPAGHKVPAPHTLRYEVEIAKDGRSNMNAMD